MNPIHLYGCRAEPLLSYLAGLGVVRLVAEQVTPEVSARWDGNHLVIAAQELDETMLIEFFADDYIPTAVISPWNSGGGFQDEGKLTSPSAQRLVERVAESSHPRLAPYRDAIVAARRARQTARHYGLAKDGKIIGKDKEKAQFIELCRAKLPDEALPWLDASVVLLDNDIAFPLILGTGGNIGRRDLSVGFLEQLEALDFFGGPSNHSQEGSMESPSVRPLLNHALFRDSEAELCRSTASQFDPGGVGGPNSSSTGDADPLANPWSFVLAMEGAMVFASAAARRLSAESQAGPSKVSMPFTVAATVVGYGSAAESESPKGELWAPLWRDEMSYREIRNFISEGRSQWGRNQARSGLDFVRATATLGVDRSVDEFVRYLISDRHGQSPLAVPIGRYKVSNSVRPEADLLRQLDDWVGRARSNQEPGAVTAALNALDRAQFAVATHGGARRLQAVLTALAEAEQAVSRSPKYRDDRRLHPIDGLLAQEWLPVLDDGSTEFRIAVGLASLSDRTPSGMPSGAEAVRGSLATLFRPVSRARYGLNWSSGGPRVPNFGRCPIFEVINDAFGARAVLSASKRSDKEADGQNAGLPFAFDYGLGVDIADVGYLLCGQFDEQRLSEILAGLLLLEWEDAFSVAAKCLSAVPDDPVARLHAASRPIYVVLAPFFAGRLPVAPTDTEPNPIRSIAVRPRPEWIGAIRTEAAHTAARSAAHLLRGRGWRLIADKFEQTSIEPGRLATALLLRLDRAGNDQRQLRFLLNHQSTIETRWSAGRERQEPHHEQA
ncbi:MAG: type I-U CRISPR-associated protein Csx17 [bacterium]|nr:type I-U CRISPR-associated protein Csx17 [bacterium]